MIIPLKQSLIEFLFKDEDIITVQNLASKSNAEKIAVKKLNTKLL